MNEESNENTKAIPPTQVDLQKEIRMKVSRIEKEFQSAFEFISKFPKSVSFYGSARVKEGNPHYEQARAIAGHISKKLGYTIITGGSAGIMEAANRGAFEAGGESVGLNIKLPREQSENMYTTASIEFSYFFVRKLALSFAAEAYIFLPGGFGTLDEFFEIITLVQTRKIRKIPIFLVGRDYWEPLHAFIKQNVYEIHQAIGKGDMSLYTITDNADEIIEVIRAVPVNDGRLHRTPRAKAKTETA